MCLSNGFNFDLPPFKRSQLVWPLQDGVEYADMQFIAECYDLLRNAGGMGNDDIGGAVRVGTRLTHGL